MALPLTEPDPLAWRVALRLAKHDQSRLKVSADGLTVWVLNNPVDDVADMRPGRRERQNALRPWRAPVLELERIRAAGGTHLAARHAPHALCGTPLAGPWTPGNDLTCPSCVSALPAEA